jgi:hypothetical protein
MFKLKKNKYVAQDSDKNKNLMLFNRRIDTVKITALSNNKPGILNNYIRINIIICKDQKEQFTNLNITGSGVKHTFW